MSTAKEMRIEKDINIIKNILVIGCKDIYLREFRLEDLDKLYELTLQREITDFLPDWISSKEQRKQWLIEDVQENNEFLESVPNVGGQCLRLVIVLKETNEVIGWCCSGIKDELPPPNREIAYAITKEHREKGYTTQAAQGLISYLFSQTNIEELNAIALLYNVPSNRVIEKNGFNHIGTVEIDKEKFNYYKINKKDKQIIGSIEKVKYRELSIDECDRISEIDPSQWIEKVWRKRDGELQLVEIYYMETTWPDGYENYRDELKHTISSGGAAFGAFNKEGIMIAFITLNRNFFGQTAKYVQLDSLFVSREYRGFGIGKDLFKLVVYSAKAWGADKLYACAASSEDTIAFYKKLGWVNAIEVNKKLYKKCELDIQLEYELK